MTSVYKTLSGKETHEKEAGEKRNKQRVLILVLSRVIKNAPRLMIAELQRRNDATSSFATRLVFVNVCYV
jgi:hypothetical protein